MMKLQLLKSKLIFCLLFIFCLFTHCAWAKTGKPQKPFPYPIDVVYTWVDGEDENWLKIKEEYKGTTEQQKALYDSHRKNRFKDNEELKYSMRSVWENAPFINHIYLVTMNQRPKWLADHPKITIIDHKDIFTNSSDLPTFNSQAIEANLHRIPNLSEHFLYFNDDVFLGLPVTPLDFFTFNGEIKVLFEVFKSASGPAVEGEISYNRAWRNTNELLNKHFNKEPRSCLAHAPFALRKSFMLDTEKTFPFVFISTSSHKFRSPNDYNITNGLLQFHWYYLGRVSVGNMTNRSVQIRDDKHFLETKRNLRRLLMRKKHTFCLQDNMGDESDATKILLNEFFEQLYPKPAPWEKEPQDISIIIE